MLKDLCLQPRVDLVSFATEQKISIPSLRRHLTRINQLLTTYQLQLKTSKGFVYLKGSEPQVRYLIYLFLWQYYQGVVWPFPTVDFHETFAGIEYAFQLTKQKPNKLKMIEWCFIIAITFVRSAQGNQMNQRELPDFTEEIWDSFEEITHFLKRMSVKAKLDLLKSNFYFFGYKHAQLFI
ncbi:helix-turn-helix domain-containing protein [Enterococcus hirae]|uniref:helix-turn-helix domain-containing protein n=1 Tax=Enterococcus hirae TaxID=1354 RepID=UPI001E48C82C|nr:helix-turn-helix domain-containing protein [Enterococcus hirae]MDT2622032.1 helix-turn-helix domain-containing protein [Enterococcus hirae]